MKSMADAVLEHAEKIRRAGGSSTYEALEFLGLTYDKLENIGAGNLYLTALRVINELKEGKRS